MNTVPPDPAPTASDGPLQSVRALAERLAAVDAQVDALQSQRAAIYRAAKRFRVSKDQLRAMALGVRQRAAGGPSGDRDRDR
jgi:hypothetical protein